MDPEGMVRDKRPTAIADQSTMRLENVLINLRDNQLDRAQNGELQFRAELHRYRFLAIAEDLPDRRPVDPEDLPDLLIG